jgi:hypothetical protein
MTEIANVRDMDAICITLLGEERSDGSVFVKSPDLPVFSAVGGDERVAFDNAMALLGPYLQANVPDYVDLRRLSGSLHEGDEPLLPAHIIACRGGDRAGHSAG